MNNDFWTKTTNYKFLGKTLFSKEEICSEMQYEGQIYQVNVSPEYFKNEFDLKDEKKNK